MGVILRFVSLLVLGISIGATVAKSSDEEQNFSLDDFKSILDGITTGISKALDLVKTLVQNVNTLIQQIKTDSDGDELLKKLQEASKAASAPLIANSCLDGPGPELEAIARCLTCEDGEWTIAITDYASCKGNAAANTKFYSVFLLLPLALLAFLH